MIQETEAAVSMDGRRRRSEQNRRRIVQAILELVQAGHASPSAEQVAERAGVGLRSVFRHFSDMDSLFQEVSEAVSLRVRPLVEEPVSGDNWRDDLNELIDRKARIFEEISQFYLVGRGRALDSAMSRLNRERAIAKERKALKKIWPRELRREKVLFEGMDLLLSFDTYVRLRVDQKLSVRKTKAVIRRMADALLQEFS